MVWPQLVGRLVRSASGRRCVPAELSWLSPSSRPREGLVGHQGRDWTARAKDISGNRPVKRSCGGLLDSGTVFRASGHAGARVRDPRARWLTSIPVAVGTSQRRADGPSSLGEMPAGYAENMSCDVYRHAFATARQETGNKSVGYCSSGNDRMV